MIGIEWFKQAICPALDMDVDDMISSTVSYLRSVNPGMEPDAAFSVLQGWAENELSRLRAKSSRNYVIEAAGNVFLERIIKIRKESLE